MFHDAWTKEAVTVRQGPVFQHHRGQRVYRRRGCGWWPRSNYVLLLDSVQCKDIYTYVIIVIDIYIYNYNYIYIALQHFI